MLEKYYKYKVKYNEYLLFIKSGNFYEIIDYDSLILNELFDLKLSKLSNTFKCGIPHNSISKYLDKLDKLDKLSINYLIIDNDEISSCKKYDNNNYKSYKYDLNLYKYNLLRVNNIYNYLTNNIHKDITNKLDRIEGIINE